MIDGSSPAQDPNQHPHSEAANRVVGESKLEKGPGSTPSVGGKCDEFGSASSLHALHARVDAMLMHSGPHDAIKIVNQALQERGLLISGEEFSTIRPKPGFVELILKSAELYEAAGQIANAEESWLKAISLYLRAPKDSVEPIAEGKLSMRISIGLLKKYGGPWTLLSASRLETALQAFRMVFAKEPSLLGAVPAIELGRLSSGLQFLGMQELAANTFLQAKIWAELIYGGASASKIDARLTAAELIKRGGAPVVARAILEENLKIIPEKDPRIGLHLALISSCYQAEGNLSLAKKFNDQALSLSPVINFDEPRDTNLIKARALALWNTFGADRGGGPRALLALQEVIKLQTALPTPDYRVIALARLKLAWSGKDRNSHQLTLKVDPTDCLLEAGKLADEGKVGSGISAAIYEALAKHFGTSEPKKALQYLNLRLEHLLATSGKYSTQYLIGLRETRSCSAFLGQEHIVGTLKLFEREREVANAIARLAPEETLKTLEAMALCLESDDQYGYASEIWEERTEIASNIFGEKSIEALGSEISWLICGLLSGESKDEGIAPEKDMVALQIRVELNRMQAQSADEKVLQKLGVLSARLTVYEGLLISSVDGESSQRLIIETLDRACSDYIKLQGELDAYDQSLELNARRIVIVLTSDLDHYGPNAECARSAIRLFSAPTDSGVQLCKTLSLDEIRPLADWVRHLELEESAQGQFVLEQVARLEQERNNKQDTD